MEQKGSQPGNKSVRYLHLLLLILVILSVALIPFLFYLPGSMRVIILCGEFFLLGSLFTLVVFVLIAPFRHSLQFPPASSYLEELTSSLAQAQREVVRLNRALEKELSAKNEKLKKIQEEMFSLQMQVVEQEKLASLAKMASGVVHEIKTPLSVMRTSTYLLKKFSKGEKVKEQVELIEGEISRIDEIATSLMDYSRSARDVPLTWVNVPSLLQEIIKELQFTGKLQNIEVINNLPSSFPPVYAHAGRLREVLINIINNAVESMESGGKLTLEGKTEKEEAHLLLKDTGAGIPPEDLKNLFDPFFSTKGKGTGLGLAISYAFVKRFGGDIRVKSIPGKGTTMELILKAKV